MKVGYLFLVGILLASGCAPQATSTPAMPVISPPVAPLQTSTSPAAQPILPAPTVSVTPLIGEEPLRPTSTLACENNLKFMADLTVPDGTIVARGAVIDKRWQVENNGTCNWDDRYRLKIVSGAEMGVQAEQALFPARSGAAAVIRLLFLAPSKPGTYRSAWQAVGPDGENFGDIIYIEVRVN